MVLGRIGPRGFLASCDAVKSAAVMALPGATCFLRHGKSLGVKIVGGKVIVSASGA
jgi:hypothetical protein